MIGKLGMLKQAIAMRGELKKVQKDLSRVTAEFSNGGVTVVARGDMTIDAFKVDMDAISGMKAEKLERLLTVVVNSALKAVQRETASKMAEMSGGLGGLSGLLGG